MGHMKTWMDFITKHLLAIGVKNVNAFSSHSRAVEFDLEEELNHLNN